MENRIKKQNALDKGKWIRLVVLLGVFMAVLDATIITIGLPAITTAFYTDIASSQWVISSYLVAITTCMLIFARFADYFGKNTIFLSGICIFTLASIGCAFSPDIVFLIVMRIIQGIGGAMAMSLAMAIIFDNSPADKQGTNLGLFGATVGLASISGPCIGGFLLDILGWKAIFLINIPIGIVLIALGFRLMNCSKPENYQDFKMDWAGAITFIITIVTCMIGMGFVAEGQEYYLYAIFCGFICIFSLVGFVYIEKRHNQPLLELSVFRQSAFVVPLIAMMLFFCSIYILLVSLPFYLQIVWNFSALQTGLVNILFSGILVIGTPFVGRHYDKTHWNHYTSLGLVICAIGLLLFAFFAESADLFLIISTMIVFGIGYALFQSPVNIEIMRGLPINQSAIASSLNNTGRHLAMAIGSSVAAIIFVFVFQMSGYSGEIMCANAGLITDAMISSLVICGFLCLAGFLLKIKEYGRRRD